jgi:hypothetical protein
VDLKSVGEAGLSAVVEGIAKVKEAIPEEAMAKAEEAKESPLAKQVMGLVTAAAAQSEVARERASEAAVVARERASGAAVVARERAAEAAEVASRRAAEAAAVAREKAADAATAARERAADAAREGSALVDSAKEADVASAHSRGMWGKVALGTVVVGAAAGAGYAFIRRRGAAAQAPDEAEGPFEPGVADEQSPDAEDEDLAREIDEAADDLAEEIVEAVEGHHEGHDEGHHEGHHEGHDEDSHDAGEWAEPAEGEASAESHGGESHEHSPEHQG